MPRAVLFDWDGTLVYGVPAPPSPVAAMAALLAERGHPAASAFEAAFASVLPPYHPGAIAVTPVLDDLVGQALRASGGDAPAALVEACCEAFCTADCAAMSVFDDARAIVASLKYRGFRLAVVSNTLLRERYFRTKLAAAGLAGYFDAVVCSADTGYGKPHPAPYRAALRALGTAPADALFVGDRPETDIAGALAAGVPAVRIDREAAAPDAAARTIDRLSGLNLYLGEGMAG